MTNLEETLWNTSKITSTDRIRKKRKKTVAFNTEIHEEEEEIDESNSEGMALINRGVRQMLRQRRQIP